jgi:hypothetical protein
MPQKGVNPISARDRYGRLVTDISGLLEQARRAAARSVNSVLTSVYWQIGRRIVEHEQQGRAKAKYGESLLVSLAKDLTERHGRGFSKSNLFQMRSFFLGWEVVPTPSRNFEARVIRSALPDIGAGRKFQTPSGKSEISEIMTTPGDLIPGTFPLSWSHYVQLMSVAESQARAFYELEAIRGGWSVRQLDRQISTQFYERTVHSTRPMAATTRRQVVRPEDAASLEDEVRDPYLLEFLNLKDEYSESELEDALVPSGTRSRIHLCRPAETDSDRGRMVSY